jgi:hypothetical protein
MLERESVKMPLKAHKPEPEVYNCTVCRQMFSSKGDMFRHHTLMHEGSINKSTANVVFGNAEKHYRCSFCQTLLSSKTELVEHEDRNHNLYPQVQEIGEMVEVDSCGVDITRAFLFSGSRSSSAVD